MTEQSSEEAQRRLLDNYIPYNSKQYDIFLEQLKTDRNCDEEILVQFSGEDHTNLFNEINLNFKKRKGKLQNCINEIEQDKEKLEKEISNLKMQTGQKMDSFINVKILEDDLHYKKIFLSMAKEELEREELNKNKAMKVIMAHCAIHGLQEDN